MMRRIILHGHLRKLAPEGVAVDADTAYDAVLGLSHALRAELAPRPGREPERVRLLGYDIDQDLYVPLGDETELHLVPAFSGGKGGLFQIVVGVVLIVVGAVVSYIPGGQSIGWFMINMGIGMVLGGVLTMLSPAPKPAELQGSGSGANPDPSQYLGQPRNTTKIGTRIPVLYGKYRVFGQILSSDIVSVEVAA